MTDKGIKKKAVMTRGYFRRRICDPPITSSNALPRNYRRLVEAVTFKLGEKFISSTPVIGVRIFFLISPSPHR